MGSGFRTILISMVATAVVGGILGLLVGVLIRDPLNTVGMEYILEPLSELGLGFVLEPLIEFGLGSVMGPLIGFSVGAFLGANFGMVLGYGFLPDAPADLQLEPEASS